MATQLFTPQPVAPTSPFAWGDDKIQRRAHGLTVRATYARKAPKIGPKACPGCFTVPAANGTCNCS